MKFRQGTDSRDLILDFDSETTDRDSTGDFDLNFL